MPRYISPLDETFIRFDAAAGLIARRDQTVTPDSVLELLVRAMWQGRFEPSDFVKRAPSARKEKENPENWLYIPIVAPEHLLTSEQTILKPLVRVRLTAPSKGQTNSNTLLELGDQVYEDTAVVEAQVGQVV